MAHRRFSSRPITSAGLLFFFIDVTIYTTDATFSDSTALFSSMTCVVFHAKMCNTGAVAMTTTTSSYTTDVYVVYLEASATHSQFGAGSIIYAKCVELYTVRLLYLFQFTLYLSAMPLLSYHTQHYNRNRRRIFTHRTAEG